MDSGVTRILVIHPEASTLEAVDQGLRSVAEAPISVYTASSLTAGLESGRRLEPHLVLLDVSEQRALALEVARGLRGRDRLLVGLYNPLVQSGEEVEFLREASRAGVSEFVALPAAESELASVLAAAPGGAAETAAAEEGMVVGFVSHKGGVGSTTLAVNTALVLAASGLVEGEVALCDAALQFGVASTVLGLAPDRDLVDLVRDLDQMGALSAYLAEQPESGLRVLASPRDPLEAEGITPEDLSRVIIALRRRFRVVVVDLPAVLDMMTLSALDLCDRVYAVTDAVAPTVLAGAKFLALLGKQGFGGDRLRLVLNRYAAGEGQLPETLVAEQLGRAPDHVIPYEEAVAVATNQGVPLVMSRQESDFSEAVGGLAREISSSLRAPVA